MAFFWMGFLLDLVKSKRCPGESKGTERYCGLWEALAAPRSPSFAQATPIYMLESEKLQRVLKRFYTGPGIY